MVPSPSWSWTTRGMFVLLVVCWGLNFPFVALGLEFASPLWLAALRSGVGALTTLGVVTALGGWGNLNRPGRRDALLLGLPNTALFFGLWFWAAASVTPGIVAVILYTFPLWVALLSRPMLGHRLGPLQLGSIGLGFVGVALISQVGEAGRTSVSIAAALELLTAALAWAVGTVVFQRRFRREEMMEANAYQLIGGSIALFGAAVLARPYPLPSPTPELFVSLLWVGVLGTAIAFTIWFSLLGRTRAATLSAYAFLVPVVALAASAVFFGERLSLLQIAGVGFVLLGIYGIGRTSAGPPVATADAPS